MRFKKDWIPTKKPEMAGIELTRTTKPGKTKARQRFADFDGPYWFKFWC
jgi:hypothetical protein